MYITRYEIVQRKKRHLLLIDTLIMGVLIREGSSLGWSVIGKKVAEIVSITGESF